MCDIHIDWLRVSWIFGILGGILLIFQVVGLFSGIFPAYSDDLHSRKVERSFCILADLATALFLLVGGLGTWQSNDKGVFIRMLLVGYGMLLYSTTIQIGYSVEFHLIFNLIVVVIVWAITLCLLFFLRKIYIS